MSQFSRKVIPLALVAFSSIPFGPACQKARASEEKSPPAKLKPLVDNIISAPEGESRFEEPGPPCSVPPIYINELVSFDDVLIANRSIQREAIYRESPFVKEIQKLLNGVSGSKLPSLRTDGKFGPKQKPVFVNFSKE